MDASNITNILPESWLSRALDLGGGIMLVMLKSVHGDFKEQVKKVQSISTEHEVFKANVANLTKTVDDVKSGNERIINILLQKHK